MEEVITKIADLDVFFLSYDEPNAERHWTDLLDKCPWADRIDRVKGFDAVHRAAAEASRTAWFVTVDADNIVDAQFFDHEIKLRHALQCLSYNGRNMLNGLIYGNGGVKVWSRAFVKTMNTHENSDDARKAIEFCWESNYQQVAETFSEVWINGSPYQAFRVAFRESVKLCLNRGHRVPAALLSGTLAPPNLRNLKVWCSIGSDKDNGLWANYGARLGLWHMCSPSFDHTLVRDYDWFDKVWQTIDPTLDIAAVNGDLKDAIRSYTGISLPSFDAEASSFVRSLL